ncbi:hypothetical protein P7C70_g8279, partial [Phenoliferia sp. Uapishka_3]
MSSVVEEEALLAPLSRLKLDFDIWLAYVEFSLDFALHSAMQLNWRGQCSDTHLLQIHLEYDSKAPKITQRFGLIGLRLGLREDAIEDVRDAVRHFDKLPDQPIDQIFRGGRPEGWEKAEEGEEHEAQRGVQAVGIVFHIKTLGDSPSHLATDTDIERFRQSIIIREFVVDLAIKMSAFPIDPKWKESLAMDLQAASNGRHRDPSFYRVIPYFRVLRNATCQPCAKVWLDRIEFLGGEAYRKVVYEDPRSYFGEEVLNACTVTERNMKKKARKAKAKLRAERAAKLNIAGVLCLFGQRWNDIAEEEALLAPLSRLEPDFDAYLSYIELSLDFALHSSLQLNWRGQCSDTHLLHIFLEYNPKAPNPVQQFAPGEISLLPRKEAIEDVHDAVRHFDRLPEQPIDERFSLGRPEREEVGEEGEEHNASGGRHPSQVVFSIKNWGESPSHAATETEIERFRQIIIVRDFVVDLVVGAKTAFPVDPFWKEGLETDLKAVASGNPLPDNYRELMYRRVLRKATCRPCANNWLEVVHFLGGEDYRMVYYDNPLSYYSEEVLSSRTKAERNLKKKARKAKAKLRAERAAKLSNTATHTGLMTIELNRPVHEIMCNNGKTRRDVLETTSLQNPTNILLCQQSHTYHDYFMAEVIRICKQLGALCTLKPDIWPPGTLIPLQLRFEYDFRKDTLRERFTLVKATVSSYEDHLDSVRNYPQDARGLGEAFLGKVKETGFEGPVFAFWYGWTHARDVPHTDQRFDTAFQRFIAIPSREPEMGFDYQKELFKLLGPVPVKPKPPNRKSKRAEERRQRFAPVA